MKHAACWTISFALGLLGAGCSGQPDSETPAGASAGSLILCADLATHPLRDYKKFPYEQTVTAPNGQELNYVVVGDSGTSTSRYMLFFNGTDNVWADWPTEMIHGSAVDLCEEYRVVLFDFPGVGGTQEPSSLGFDDIGNGALAVLQAAEATYGDATEVSALGWSLGALAAAKFGYLLDSRTDLEPLEHLILIAVKGSVGDESKVQASCLTNVLAYKADHCDDTAKELELLAASENVFGLMFPYEGQTATSPLGECTGSTTYPFDLDVTLQCPENARNTCADGNRCECEWEIFKSNSETWHADSHSSRIPCSVYRQERDMVADWNRCVCTTSATAGSAGQMVSRGCSCAEGYTPGDATNGAVVSCELDTERNQPVCRQAMPLGAADVTVINGQEDLFIQHCWGQAFAAAYNHATGGTRDYARLCTYPGSAGHGVLLTDPTWVNETIASALDGTWSGCTVPRETDSCTWVP